MAVLFSESKTKQNLMRAFAGEGQARNRYTFAAEQARKEGKPAVADIFLYTADQERAHAGRYYELLKEASGTNIFIDGSYPVDETKTRFSCCVRQNIMSRKRRRMCIRHLQM